MQSLDLKVVPCWISISWLTLKQTRLFRSVLGVGKHQCFPNIPTVFPWVTHMSNQGLWRRCNLPRDQLWLVVVGARTSTERNTVWIHMEFRSSYFVFWGLKTVLAKWTVLPYYGSTRSLCGIYYMYHMYHSIHMVSMVDCCQVERPLPFPGPGINDLLPVFAPRRFLQRCFPAWWVFESQNSWMGWCVRCKWCVPGFLERS